MKKCKACEENGYTKQAVVLAAQSTDQGKTVTMTLACKDHYDYWWDGADWDGKHLTVKLEN